jgi:serine/threonine-protein kinase
MFVDEVRLMSMLRSDNIVDVYDLDEDDETFYAVVELVDGPSLSAALRLHQKKNGDPAIAIDVAARVVVDVCDALSVVHSAKDADGAPLDLVHRDVNPQNILVGRDDVVKLSDFGVARSSLLRKSGSLVASGTDAGVLKGKASYLAPEQVLGHAVDHRADLFAVGVTLYVAVTGYAPFVGGSDVELLDAIAHQRPQAPSTLLTLPKPLEALTLALLEKDPAQRPSSAADVKAELAAFAGASNVVGEFVRGLGLPSLRA